MVIDGAQELCAKLEERQIDALKKLSKETKVPQAELLRQAVDLLEVQGRLQHSLKRQGEGSRMPVEEVACPVEYSRLDLFHGASRPRRLQKIAAFVAA